MKRELSSYNPRYLFYCRAQGNKNNPEKQMELDDEKWPGGVMTGFILWINQGCREFRAFSPQSFVGDTIQDHKAFDSFLNSFDFVIE